MNFLSPRSLSLVAATAVLTAVSMVQTEAAHAFLIKRTAGPSVPAGVNPSLAAPTVIDFADLSGDVSTTETFIGPGVTGDGLNGGATIQRLGTGGNATYFGEGLRIGPGAATSVSFRFDHPNGMGYFGFFLEEINGAAANFTISFWSNNSLIETLTGAQVNTQAVGFGNYFNFFVTNNDEIFDQVVFAKTATGDSFLRIDNVAYQAIPTPALLPGLVGLAFGAVRKRKAEAEAEA